MYQPCILTSSMSILSHKKTSAGGHSSGSLGAVCTFLEESQLVCRELHLFKDEGQVPVERFPVYPAAIGRVNLRFPFQQIELRNLRVVSPQIGLVDGALHF